jgi:uncharacterized protein YjlB
LAEVDTHWFADDGAIPNSRLPVLIYNHVEAAQAAASDPLHGPEVL